MGKVVAAGEKGVFCKLVYCKEESSFKTYSLPTDGLAGLKSKHPPNSYYLGLGLQ